MGILVRQNDNRSELQERLAEELKERTKTQSIGSEPIDQTKDSNYLKGTEQTSDRMWVWFVVGGLIVISAVAYFLFF